MALHRDMQLLEMRRFIQEEVKEQILYEITPILHLGYAAGGYFGVTRQIACMIGFLGALYAGFDPINDRKPASSSKAERYLEEIFGIIDENYQKNGRYFIEMYRHGLVHLYQPRELRIPDGRVLTWLPYKGGRKSDISVSNSLILSGAAHLAVVFGAGRHFLPVSIKCLYDDLLTSIDIYVEKLEQSERLQSNFVSMANEIIEPVNFKE